MTSSEEQSQARLLAIVQWSADAIVSSDPNHIVTSWNPAAEKLFGYTAGEMVGQSFEITVPPEHIEGRRRQLESLRPGEAVEGVETVRVRKDGSRVEVEITSSTLQDANGNVIGWSSILRDISERKAAEAQLRELENRYRTFVEQMPALTYIQAPGSEWSNIPLLHLSARVEDVLGYSAQHWIEDPRYMFAIMHPDDHDRVLELDILSAETGQPFHAEYRVFAPDDQIRWIRDDAIIVQDEDGQPLYWLGFLLDITDQKRAEEELMAALAGLRQMNAELERVGKTKNEFLSMISHEFRLPLTSIQGYSELIADLDLSEEEIRSFAGIINTNARRLARMIRDLLDLDQLESGRIPVHRENVDLNAIVDNVLDSFEPASSGHRLVSSLDPRLPLIRGDSDLLTQVVTNLVGNALKYSPEGGAVEVSSTMNGDLVRLTVRDHGLGIPRDQVETIFARYERISRPEQDRIEGAGLGLAIARQIVELHRGRIWVELPEDGGSRFVVDVPQDGTATVD